MTAYAKQESNSTGLTIAEETSLGVVDGGTVWNSREPNSYKDFGGQFKLVARNPINASRQQRKGVITDLDAAGGWQEDLTYQNIQGIIQGIMFANFRKKAELASPGVDGTAHAYNPAAGGAAFIAGDLLFAKGFTNGVNNGLKTVSGTPTGTSVTVSDTGVVNETGSAGIISKVGHVGAAGDVGLMVAAGLYTLTSTAFDFTTLGLVAGDWLWIGGDTTGTKFATAANNGAARVLTVAAHAIVLDKVSNAAAATDTGTGKTIPLYIGRFLKNESNPDLIVRRTYAIERQVGKEDTTSTYRQAEYLNGAVLNEFVLNLNAADKATYELTTLACSYETRDNTQGGPKAGSRPVLVGGGAYNTSTNIKMTNLHVCGSAAPLFAYLMDVAITIKNNCKTNKALSTLGAFDITAGEFMVSATATAYFATVDALASIKNNDSVTLDFLLTRDNQGMICDIPLATLGDGRLNVAQNSPVMLKLDVDAASASVLSPLTDYTLGWTFFDYLPNAAM